jgi:hypothetical protein
MLGKAIGLVICMGVMTAAQAAPGYSVEVLGNAASSYSSLLLNDSGALVARTFIHSNPSYFPVPQSYIFSRGSKTLLTSPESSAFSAVGIAADGAVLGGIGNDHEHQRPVMWIDGQSHFLDMPEGAISAMLHGSNAAGDMVGDVRFGPGSGNTSSLSKSTSVVWRRDGTFELLSVPSGDIYLPGFVTPYAISDNGLVIGTAGVDPDGDGWLDDYHLVQWSTNGFEDRGVLEFAIDPRRINASNQIIGTGISEDEESISRGYLIGADNVRVPLPTLGELSSTGVEDINDSGWMVGSDWLNGESTAVLWRDGSVIDLNTLIDPAAGLTLIDARAINNRGQIGALALNADGVEQIVLLTPVPEPKAWALLLGGVLVVALRVRARGELRSS